MKKFIVFLMLFLCCAGFAHAYIEDNHISLLTVAEAANNSETGGIADLYLSIKPGSGRIFIDSFPLSKIDTQITTRFATELACDFLEYDCSKYDFFYTIRANSAIVGGPSAGAATAVLAISSLDNAKLDEKTVMTGTINSGNLIGPVAGIDAKSNAAQNLGFKKILIPKWEIENETIDGNLSITVVRVSTLEEALYEFTGKNYTKNYPPIMSSETYQKYMQEIAKELCTKYGSVSPNGTLMLPNISDLVKKDAPIPGPTAISDETADSSKDFFSLAIDAINNQEYYSAASFCFAGNYEIAQEIMKNYTNEQLRTEYASIFNQINILDDSIDNNSVSFNTISQLETYMVVKERLFDARNSLKNAATKDENNILTNLSYSEIAYAKERLATAIIWSRFFNLPGEKFTLDENSLKSACSKKLSEAEERINYLEMYFPKDINREELAQAYDYLNEENYVLCIFTASKAKASVDVVLSALFIDQDNMDNLLDEKLAASQKVIAREESKNIFPILGYSYYEYAKTLQNTDQLSSLLYAEYSLELSNLDMYFPKENGLLPSFNFNWKYFWFFLLGLSVGMLFVIVLGIIFGKKDKKKNIVVKKEIKPRKRK